MESDSIRLPSELSAGVRQSRDEPPLTDHQQGEGFYAPAKQQSMEDMIMSDVQLRDAHDANYTGPGQFIGTLPVFRENDASDGYEDYRLNIPIPTRLHSPRLKVCFTTPSGETSFVVRFEPDDDGTSAQIDRDCGKRKHSFSFFFDRVDKV